LTRPAPPHPTPPNTAPHRPRGHPAEVFAVFLRLGLTSFGGPVAHLGYFREALVTRRAWLSEGEYADLVALCQFLPGPASSQVGVALGLMRAGWLGGLAAFVAFTLPSALLLVAFALGAVHVGGPLGAAALQGLKIVAVAIVAQAVWGMALAHCPDRPRAAIATAALALLAFVPGSAGMMLAIALGALAGLSRRAAPRASPPPGDPVTPVSRRIALGALGVFAACLVGLPLLAPYAQTFAILDAFFRAGALVFGGGHVVLPLLEAETVARGWVSAETFVAGYGAAQAMPGPLFTFAAFLGATLEPAPNGMTGAALALGAIFLPGFLLLIAALPYWEALRRSASAQALMQGANAAVVGILCAALYAPVFTQAIHDLRDLALALVCFLLLTLWRSPPLAVVVIGASGGVALHLAASFSV
jgi:chromate transporter